MRSALLAAAFLLLPGASRAAGVGTTGAQFLNVGIGARPLAMGSAFVALPDDANAINWNPGALAEVKQRNVTASYNSLFQDENQGFLGFAAPLTVGTAGFGLNYLVVSNIQRRSADTESADSTFSNQNFALSASYARPVPIEGLSVGGSLKFIRETLDAFSGSAVALDMGALYRTPVQNLKAGFMVQNLGTRIGPDPLPVLVKGGLGYGLLEQRLVLVSDLDWKPVDKRTYLDFGAEFWANKALALRAGYQFGHGQDQLGSRFVGAGIGLGFKLDRLRLDYAFLPFGNLGDTHRITVGWSF